VSWCFRSDATDAIRLQLLPFLCLFSPGPWLKSVPPVSIGFDFSFAQVQPSYTPASFFSLRVFPSSYPKSGSYLQTVWSDQPCSSFGLCCCSTCFEFLELRDWEFECPSESPQFLRASAWSPQTVWRSAPSFARNSAGRCGSRSGLSRALFYPLQTPATSTHSLASRKPAARPSGSLFAVQNSWLNAEVAWK